ncbi:MAG: alpha/beta hydrolase [Pseudomonadota bacterium]
MRSILLHGGPGLKNYWSQVFSDDQLQGFEHFEFPLADNIDDYVFELKNRVQGSDCALIGHSFGGTIALEAISRAQLPEAKKLVLVSSPVSSLAQQAHENEMKRLGLDPENPLQVFLSKLEMVDPQCTEQLMSILQTIDVKCLELMGASYLSKFDLSRTVAELNIPCLILFGSEDHRLPVETQRNLGHLNSGLQFEVIEGAGHFPFLTNDHKNRFLQLVREFSAEN